MAPLRFPAQGGDSVPQVHQSTQRHNRTGVQGGVRVERQMVKTESKQKRNPRQTPPDDLSAWKGFIWDPSGEDYTKDECRRCPFLRATASL